MKRSFRVLINHPMTIWGHETLLKNLPTDYCFEMESAKNCDEVLKKMKSHKQCFFDLVLFDINLPPSKNNEIVNGEDLSRYLRKKNPGIKLIVHTALNHQQRISNIFKNLNPEGFLIKSDIDPEVLSDAVSSVLAGNTCYSEATNRLIGHSTIEDIFLDTSDQKIPYHLSKDQRMKDLPKHVPLAIATIEQRKKKLKMRFGVPNGSDRELLDMARAKGFV